MALSSTIKAIQDIMRKDVGVDGDAQRIGQLVWLLFLKIWDDREQELELLENSFVSPLVGVRWTDAGGEKMRLVKEGKISKPMPPPSVSEDEVPFKVPEGWVKCRLGDLIDLVSGQHLGPSEYHSERTGLPYLTGPADFGPVYPAATRWTNERRAVALGGDLLLTVKGAGIGKTNELDAPEAAISRQLMAIRPLLGIGSYLNLVIANAASHFREKQQGIAIPGIGREDVLYYCLAVPPLLEQHRIVAKVDALMALLDRLEAAKAERETARAALRDSTLALLRDAPDAEAVEAAWTRIAERMDDLFADPADVVPLRQTILQLAVRGKLVPQNPNDEPACVLLERIAAEKAQLVKKGKISKPSPLSPVGEDEVPFEVPKGWVWCEWAIVSIS